MEGIEYRFLDVYLFLVHILNPINYCSIFQMESSSKNRDVSLNNAKWIFKFDILLFS